MIVTFNLDHDWGINAGASGLQRDVEGTWAIPRCGTDCTHHAGNSFWKETSWEHYIPISRTNIWTVHFNLGAPPTPLCLSAWFRVSLLTVEVQVLILAGALNNVNISAWIYHNHRQKQKDRKTYLIFIREWLGTAMFYGSSPGRTVIPLQVHAWKTLQQ